MQHPFVIENKFGSSEHSGQLDRYFRLLNDEDSEDYDFAYVYLDPDANERLESGDSKFNNWVGLNYDWVADFCERIVDRNMLPEKANYLVKCYQQHLTEEEYGAEPSDQLENYVSDLLAEYGDLIGEFKTYEIQVEGEGAVELIGPSVVALAEYIPKIKSDDDLLITKIYLKYSYLIDHLIFSSKTSYFEKIITERCPGYELEFEPEDNSFCVYNVSWKRFSNDLADKNDRWCLYVGVVFDKDDENRAAAVRIWIKGKYIQAHYSDALLAVFQSEFDFKRKRFFDGYNTIKLYDPIEDEEEAIDKLVVVIQKLSQILQVI